MMFFQLLATIFLYFKDNRKQETQEATVSTVTGFAAIFALVVLYSMIAWSWCVEKLYITKYDLYLLIAICIVLSFGIVYFYKSKILRVADNLRGEPIKRKRWRIVVNVIVIFLVCLQFYSILFAPSFLNIFVQ